MYVWASSNPSDSVWIQLCLLGDEMFTPSSSSPPPPPPPCPRHPPTLRQALRTSYTVLTVFLGEEQYGASSLAGRLSGPDLALIERVRGKERNEERACMAEVQYCGLQWLMAYGKSCCFSPPFFGRPALLWFASCVSLSWLIALWQTDRQTGGPSRLNVK